MGGLSSIFGLGKKKSTGTMGLDDIVNRAREIGSRPFNPYPHSRVAPFNPALQKGLDTAYNSAGKYEGHTQKGVDALLGLANKDNPYDRVSTGSNAQKISTNRFFEDNPYISQYFDKMYSTGKNALDRTQGMNQAAFDRKYATGLKRSSSGRSLAQDNLNRSYSDAEQALQSSIYDKAANLFNQDENRALDAQKAQATINNSDLDRLLRADMSNQSAGLSNNQQQLGALSAYLNGINQMYNMNKSDIGSLLQAGGVGQNYSQAVLDDNVKKWDDKLNYDWDQLTKMANLIRGDSQAASRGERSQNPFGQALDAVGPSLISGLVGGLFSDRRLKENIEHVGVENGHNIYDFNYKGDSQRYRGVMADEVEHIDGAVFEDKSGYKKVDYSKLGVPFRKIKGD